MLPRIGNQWNTSGGSFGLLSSNCCNTLSTTDSTRKETVPVATRTGREAVEVKAPNGPAISETRPMARKSQERRGQEEWRGGVVVVNGNRGVDNKFGKPLGPCSW